MASYRGHLSFAAPLGAAYGALAFFREDYQWGMCLLGAGFTTVGGLLPDLDSDSGVPVREGFAFLAAVSAFAVYHPLRDNGYPLEQALVVMAGIYFLVRYVFSKHFRRWTVHRGMFHSIPAIFIAGFLTYLGYPSKDIYLKIYLAGAVMLGFLSHLVLDEIYSVNLNGFRVKLNKFAGSALKFRSPSVPATMLTYVLLMALGYCTWHGTPDWLYDPSKWPRPAWMDDSAHTANIP